MRTAEGKECTYLLSTTWLESTSGGSLPLSSFQSTLVWTSFASQIICSIQYSRTHQLSNICWTSSYTFPSPTQFQNDNSKCAEDEVGGGRRLGGGKDSGCPTIPQRWHSFPKKLQHDPGWGGGWDLPVNVDNLRCRWEASWFTYRTPPTLSNFWSWTALDVR